MPPSVGRRPEMAPSLPAGLRKSSLPCDNVSESPILYLALRPPPLVFLLLLLLLLLICSPISLRKSERSDDRLRLMIVADGSRLCSSVARRPFVCDCACRGPPKLFLKENVLKAKCSLSGRPHHRLKDSMKPSRGATAGRANKLPRNHVTTYTKVNPLYDRATHVRGLDSFSLRTGIVRCRTMSCQPPLSAEERFRSCADHMTEEVKENRRGISVRPSGVCHRRQLERARWCLDCLRAPSTSLLLSMQLETALMLIDGAQS